ncbi:DUF2850 domain-containing protein [Vibrio sp. JC009]|uniref:DUF2850 domain-containing protein n=1 Tax=Vibrio sp. JC009 TaxID=2912314 RepID=UPI0023AEFEF8|nr:DUF2850 domain-containing protein [Vibrio sp. JC009]WED21242.1 DUF2850 domain-containing protein [Vibrio sp. JC009]
MFEKESSWVEQESQQLKKAIVLVGGLLLLLVLGAGSVLLNRYIEKQEYQNKVQIYGEWIEQGVPHFARDRFIVREEGIYVEERIVDTKYTFNGRELRYHYEGKEFVYKVKNEEMTELQRVAPVHYQSTFRLKGTEEPDTEEMAEESELLAN